MSILLPKNVSSSSITYGAMKTLESGAKSVYVNHAGQSLIIQTPAMIAPFGMSKFDKADSNGEKEKWTLQMAFKDVENNVPVGNFFKFVNEFDGKMVADGVENTKLWFKKVYVPEVLKELYTNQVIYSKDKITGEITDKFPPNFRFTVPVQDGKIMCDCFKRELDPATNKYVNKQVSLSTIEKGSRIKAILQCQGLWFAGSKFGCSWKPIQIFVMDEPATAIKGFAFKLDDDEETEYAPMPVPVPPSALVNKITDEDEDEEEEEATPEPVAAAAAVAVPASAEINESNSDYVESSEDEEEPKAPIKKVVIKKKPSTNK
jgi:hypothetical protein